MNTVPYEIIAAPYTAWIAPVGTTFPTLDEDPSELWTKVGTSGALNYMSDEGVTVEHPQTVKYFRSLGDSGPRKGFRDEEDLKVRLVLADLTLEQYALAINQNTVTTVPAGMGTAGYRKLGFSRGFTVATVALLVRGSVSPYGADWISQYQVWRAQQSGNPSVVYKKADPAGLALEWTALVDPDQDEDERLGILIVQDADPET